MNPAMDAPGADAITFLKYQHDQVKSLFANFDRAGASEEGRKIAAELVETLSRHEAAEEMKLWPKVRSEVPGGQALVDHILTEEQKGKKLLDEVDKLTPGDARFTSTMLSLKQAILEHVATEEQQAFPKVQGAFTSQALMDLGEELRQAEKMAPTRPHPEAPNTPPGNVVAGMGARVVDEVRDAMGQGVKKPGE